MGRATARTHTQVAHDTVPEATPKRRTSSQANRFATGSHADLFAEASVVRCDVCNARLDPSRADEQGTGVYLWVRGDEVRREEAPLCPSCSGAIIASALGFIEYNDEE